MRALRLLGISLIVIGILFGVLTFVFLSYGLIYFPGGSEMFWFWQGPVVGSVVSILGAVLAVLARGRRFHRTIP